MKKDPKISIIIPTKNSEKYLKDCLDSVKRQLYSNLEIIISDGLSNDETINIAKKYGCKILINKDILAEPGVSLGIKESRGDFCVVLAVDNFFADPHAIEKMVDMAIKNKLEMIFPKHCSKSTYNLITKYINHFSDPFTHFVKGYSTNGRTFSKRYSIVNKTEHGTIFNFNNSQELPIIALAQGILVSKKVLNDRANNYDDILPIIDHIKKGKNIGFAKNICLYHDTISNLDHFYRKQKWAARNAFLKKKFGISSRIKTLTQKELFLSAIFPFYGIFFLPALIFSLYNFLLKGEGSIWLMHAPLSFISSIAIWQEFIYSLFDKTKNNVSRL